MSLVEELTKGKESNDQTLSSKQTLFCIRTIDFHTQEPTTMDGQPGKIHLQAPSDPIVAELIRRSIESCEYSYCPYSKFPVGAALLCQDGTIYTGKPIPSTYRYHHSNFFFFILFFGSTTPGCNVENASYSIGICAERTTLVKAVSEGHRKFKALALSAPKYPDFISPCGACRQFLVEVDREWASVCV